MPVIVLDLKSQPGRAQPLAEVAPSTAQIVDVVEPSGGAVARGTAELAARFAASIQQHVLAGDTFNDLAEKVEAIKTGLPSALEQDRLSESADEMSAVLASFQDRVRESSRETAESFRQILSLVNESVGCIQSGNEKSDARLKFFEEGLTQAARIDSLALLRRHLARMLDFVRQETKLDKTERDTTFRSITEQLRQAHAAGSRFRVQMPGRLEAIEHFKALLAAPKVQLGTQVTLFVVDSLKALRARHGDEVASTALEELGHKQIQPFAAEGKLFCWSGTSLALTWQHAFAATPASQVDPVPSLFEHRAFIGNRVATFRMNVRFQSTPLSAGLDEVVASLDRFSKEKVA